MKARKTGRGFVVVEHPTYGNEPILDARLIQESSAIGDYKNSYGKPGSSFLWVGEDHHLNREEVAKLIIMLRRWLKKGRLPVLEVVGDAPAVPYYEIVNAKDREGETVCQE